MGSPIRHQHPLRRRKQRHPRPSCRAPANGASVVQPITLDWNPTSAPGGPIGSYTWQVGTSSAFTTVVASGFRNMDSDTVPPVTDDKVSGLPNGTYFWRVKATQMVGGATGSVESAWSAVRSFAVTGLGAAPGIPAFNTPTTGASFHVRESFKIKWSAVAGAHYYLLEVDDEPSFSYPLTLTTNSLTFGTTAEGGWGNALPDVYYRVRAVSAENVRGIALRDVECAHHERGARSGCARADFAGRRGKRATAIFLRLVRDRESAGARI